MSESFRWLAKLFHAGLRGFKKCWLMQGTWWDLRSEVGVLTDSWAAGTNGNRSQVFFCVNETLITTNTHKDSQRCSRKTTSAHLTISESQNQWSVFACSSQSVSVLHYNLQSTRGRRRAALRWGATVDSVTGRNRKGRRLASVCVFLCMCVFGNCANLQLYGKCLNRRRDFPNFNQSWTLEGRWVLCVLMQRLEN